MEPRAERGEAAAPQGAALGHVTGGRGFTDVIRRARQRNILFSVLLELTYRCNLDCYFCYNDVGLSGEPLSLARYLQLLEELRELGVLNLILSGGEPLAHPEFFTIGSRARELGFAVRVKSNGHALRSELARRLKREVDPFAVEVSLHGSTAATHDRQTRVPGSFDRLMDNLAAMRQAGLRVKLNSTLTAWNEGELEAMRELARDLGLPLTMDPEVTAKDDGDTAPLAIRPSREALLRLFRLQAEARAARASAAGSGAAPAAGEGCAPAAQSSGSPGEKHCGAGAATVAVDPYGTVYPCVQWRRPIGNLHTSSFREIWTGSPALEEVRRENAEAREMVERLGPTGKLVGFCPGSGYAGTGSPTGLHAEASRRLALLGESSEKDTPARPLLRVLQ